MISAGVSVATIILYSLLIACRESVQYVDALPLILVFFVRSIPVIQLIKKIAILNVFILFLCGTIVLFYGDIGRAVLIFLRSNMILSMSLMLFAGQPAIYSYFGFKSLRFPDKFTVLMFFTVKYIEALSKEYTVMKNSLKLRGFIYKTDLFTYRTIAYMFGMLFIRSMVHARSTHDAMVLRGFNGILYRMDEVKMTWLDVVLLGTLIVQLFVVLEGM